MPTEQFEAAALPDKELGGFMGVVRFFLDGQRIWTDSTNITRTDKKDAMQDARILMCRYAEELAEAHQ
jgi:hypothetical protein